MECPDCHCELHNTAKYCGCGWRKPNQNATPPRASVPCAHQDCGIDAMCKIKTPTGWANLCWQHYDAHFLAQGQATCERLGLDTVEKQRAYFREGFRKLAGRSFENTQREAERLKQREPGEDWDETPATA